LEEAQMLRVRDQVGNGARQKESSRQPLLHELFEEQADRNANAAAVICGNEVTTYGELEEKANRIAHHLRRLEAGIVSWLLRS
jgi:non-ribosomal peptide synthetase component F